MFYVLAEMNCLQTLNKFGIYPDEFYTDIAKFKENSVAFWDATILIIFAGNNFFNKRHVVELAKDLLKRIELKDGAVKHVYVISDSTLPSLGSYYKYTHTMDKVDIMRGWNCVKKGIIIWHKLKTPEKKSICFMSPYDMGSSIHIKRQIESSVGLDDDYRKLIQIPDLKKLLTTS